MSSITKQSGVTLIESMIALLVISVGLLGIAGLQIHALKQNSSAYWHTQAVLAAYNMADRIRANPRAGIAYTAGAVNNNCVGAGIDCDEAQMAGNDIFLWDQQATNSLPNGNVAILFDDTVLPPVYTITVAWDEPGEQLSYQIIIPVLGL